MDKQALSVGGQYQLDVDINTVVFWHHHLFSEEHVFASQITRMYEEYVSRTRKKTAEFLTGKVSDTNQHSFWFAYVLHVDIGGRTYNAKQQGCGVQTPVFCLGLTNKLQ